MSSEIAELDSRGLRSFGLQMGELFAGVFGVLLPFLFGRPFPYWPWALAVAFVGAALIAPAALRPVHYAWMTLALILNRVTSPIFMSVVFFLLITPIGWLRRTLAPRMETKGSTDSSTYRVPSRVPKAEDLERPF